MHFNTSVVRYLKYIHDSHLKQAVVILMMLFHITSLEANMTHLKLKVGTG